MLRYLILLEIFAISHQTIAGEGCDWDIKYRSQNAHMELSEIGIRLAFKDAVTCAPVGNARIIFGDLQGNTDSEGHIVIPMNFLEGKLDDKIAMTVSKHGYLTMQSKVPVEMESIWKQRFLMSPILNINQARFTMQWGESPRDLDLHLTGTRNGAEVFHISYRNMRNASNKAVLDRDDVNRYGPETITLLDIRPDMEYSLKVHSYSGEKFKLDGKERITVYLDNKFKEEIMITNAQGKWANILRFSDNAYWNLQTGARTGR